MITKIAMNIEFTTYEWGYLTQRTKQYRFFAVYLLKHVTALVAYSMHTKFRKFVARNT